MEKNFSNEELIAMIEELKRQNELLKNGNKPFKELERNLTFRFVDDNEITEALNHYDKESRMINKLKSEKDFSKRAKLAERMKIFVGNKNKPTSFKLFETFSVNTENGQIMIDFAEKASEESEE